MLKVYEDMLAVQVLLVTFVLKVYEDIPAVQVLLVTFVLKVYEDIPAVQVLLVTFVYQHTAAQLIKLEAIPCKVKTNEFGGEMGSIPC